MDNGGGAFFELICQIFASYTLTMLFSRKTLFVFVYLSCLPPCLFSSFRGRTTRRRKVSLQVNSASISAARGSRVSNTRERGQARKAKLRFPGKCPPRNMGKIVHRKSRIKQLVLCSCTAWQRYLLHVFSQSSFFPL